MFNILIDEYPLSKIICSVVPIYQLINQRDEILCPCVCPCWVYVYNTVLYRLFLMTEQINTLVCNDN